MSCPFCNLDREKLENKILDETNSFILLPALGSLVDGYVLIVSKRHVRAMSELTSNEKVEYKFLIDKYKKIFKDIYGTIPMVMEHGGLNSKGVNSVSHAHTHIVNFKFKNEKEILKKNGFRKRNSIDNISSNKNYVMYDNDYDYYVTYKDLGISQVMRREIAKELGIPDMYDWRSNYFLDNVYKTIIKLMSYKENKVCIRNKLESIKKIEEDGLNRFPEELFYQGEEDKVKRFLEKYPAKYYAIRDRSKNSGVFKLKILYDEVLDSIKDYEIFTINVSSYNYVSSQLLVGEVEILSNNMVYLTLTTDPEGSVRTALEKPVYNIKTNIFDKQLDEIPYFDLIYEYIASHNLKDLIVELALFKEDVGITKERIIIYEIRNYY